jgi:polysaccharide export outer membrane protein
MEHPMAKNNLARISVLLCLCGAFSVLYAQQNGGQGQDTSEASSNVISPGDVLSVQVFDTPELSSDAARVDGSGQLTLPVLGAVKVGGLNQTEAARFIESELRTRGVMLDPHVLVSIVDYSAQSATMLGEVRAPGVYPAFGGRRLLEMIALAGGVAPTAGKTVTISHRSDPEHPDTIHLVANAQALGSQQNPIILPGDIVMVARAGIVYILGDVGKPGGYLVDNNEHISLLEALTLAGGWQREAALSKARLIRKVPEGHKELQLDLKHVVQGQQADVYVENGDILYVPASLGKTLAYRGMEAAVAAAQTAVVFAGNN